MTAVPDIPRLYTALAECLATLLYARQLAPRYSARRSTVNSLIWMAGLAVFMQLTGSVPLMLWLPCMVAAIGSMYLFLWRTCETTPLEAGYYCARAFILAELAASVEWQLHCALWPRRTGRDPLAVLLLVLVYGVLFTAVYWMEKRRSTQPAKLLNLFLPEGKKINPMIGAAGISAFPMSGRVVNQMGLAEDNQNFLLMYSISVNVSGQIASVIAGGLILTLMNGYV